MTTNTLFELHISRGTFVNDDPQRRCYNGCYFAYHYEWSEYELWSCSGTYESREKAEFDKKLFSREDLKFKIVEVVHE